MRITVVPQFHNPGHSRVFETVAHWPSGPELRAVCSVLRSQQIPVTTTSDGPHNTVHVCPGRELSTAEEVLAPRAFAAVTDSRLAWHKAATA